MTSKTARYWITAVAAAAMLLAPVTADAAAPTVTCGVTLKANATLTKDLSCPAGNGITLYKGVVLNLGGHKLLGPGTKSGTAVTMSYKGGSTVTNGTIQNWKTGVSLPGDETLAPLPISTVSKVILSSAAVSSQWGSLDLVTVTATNSPIGAQSGVGASISVTGSRLVKSNVFAFNQVVNVKTSTITAGQLTGDYGINVDTTTMDGTGYTDRPILCNEAVVTITNSTIKNYPQPVGGFYCYETVRSSTFLNNPGGALRSSPEGNEGPNMIISGSKFSNNGIAVQAGSLSVENSTFTGNTTGILATQLPTTITGSTFTNNTSSGIRTDLAGITLARNKATNNGGYGMYAPAAIDKGGNVAYGNKRGQCVGLICAGS